MGKFVIEYKDKAIEDLKNHKKSGNKSVMNRISRIIQELEEHPYTGFANPHALKHELSGYWSREINKKDRLVYKVIEERNIVDIYSALGHYSDK